jgi:hypothetical protein
MLIIKVLYTDYNLHYAPSVHEISSKMSFFLLEKQSQAAHTVTYSSVTPSVRSASRLVKRVA